MVVSYTLISLGITLFNYAVLSSPFALGFSEQYNLENQLFVSLVTGMMAGLLSGISLITVNNHRYFRKKPFRLSLIFTSIVYVIVFALVVLVSIGITARFWRGANASWDNMFWTMVEVLSTFTLTAYFVLWGFITLMTLFLLQVNDKFGPGILIKFLRGQYHSPRDEQRIFMFLDMRSSTSIAEKIGHHNYFNLLRDLFADITPTILKYGGEIYQYVGDEIVLSWPLERGLKNSNCIRCFLEIEENLKKLASDYDKKYGCSPEFKAGLHFGQVTAGEVGIIKKDIIYSGDVLNTAARIQGQCNHYKVNLLLSEDLFHLLDHDDAFELVNIGSIELRGRQEKVSLSTLRVA